MVGGCVVVASDQMLLVAAAAVVLNLLDIIAAGADRSYYLEVFVAHRDDLVDRFDILVAQRGCHDAGSFDTSSLQVLLEARL